MASGTSDMCIGIYNVITPSRNLNDPYYFLPSKRYPIHSSTLAQMTSINLTSDNLLPKNSSCFHLIISFLNSYRVTRPSPLRSASSIIFRMSSSLIFVYPIFVKMSFRLLKVITSCSCPLKIVKLSRRSYSLVMVSIILISH